MFGMGFTEILIIAVIAIIFLGPDKLPTAMVEIAKFFRNAKKTIGTVKNTIEEEMHVSDIKKEAIAYRKELLDASDNLKKSTDTSQISSKLTKIGDDILDDIKDDDDNIFAEEDVIQKTKKPQEVTFEKKDKQKENQEKDKDIKDTAEKESKYV